eukprot:jgi/Chlat1/3670/Chrsp24S03857
MKILEKSVGLLTNLEVLNCLIAKKDKPSAARKAEAKIIEYLQQTPAGTQSRSDVASVLSAVEATYGLTKAEKLQVANLRPSTAVEVHLVVEDCEERLKPEQVDALIDTIDSILPAPPETGPQLEEEQLPQA